MEKRIDKLIINTQSRLSKSQTNDGKTRLQEQLDFLQYIKTGKKPTYYSGILHLITN